MLIENNGIKYFSSPLVSSIELTSGDSVRHAFFTRIGGTSKAPFNELNIDPLTGDDPIAVSSNLQKIASVMGFNESRLVTLKQVHGDRVYKAEDGALSSRNMEADAVITNGTDIAISIKTADCVPLLLIDPVTNSIGAVHAGWRGTVKKITAKTIHAMNENYGTKSENIIALIGPHIKSCCYEVSPDVTGEFERAFPGADEIVQGKMIDLAEANIRQLTDLDVSSGNITVEGDCTCCSKDLLFSHRRDGTPGPTGRQISIIYIKGT